VLTLIGQPECERDDTFADTAWGSGLRDHPHRQVIGVAAVGDCSRSPRPSAMPLNHGTPACEALFIDWGCSVSVQLCRCLPDRGCWFARHATAVALYWCGRKPGLDKVSGGKSSH
jgi:hypothetical protein